MSIYVVGYQFSGFDAVRAMSVVVANSEERAKELVTQPGLSGIKVTLIDQETPEGVLVFDGIAV